MRDAFDARRGALGDDELLETTTLRLRCATEVERLQHRICTAALGVRGEEQASVVFVFIGEWEKRSCPAPPRCVRAYACVCVCTFT